MAAQRDKQTKEMHKKQSNAQEQTTIYKKN